MIGPFALRGVDTPWLGSLFEQAEGGAEEAEGFFIPVSESLWSMAQVGAIVLLFNTGLRTLIMEGIGISHRVIDGGLFGVDHHDHRQYSPGAADSV